MLSVVSLSLCRDNWRKGHSVMELLGMQRKRQETTAELTDKFKCAHNRNIFCLNHTEPLNYLKFRVMMGLGRDA